MATPKFRYVIRGEKLMIIADLPCLKMVCDLDEVKVKGGKQNSYYDNRATSVALSYADGLETFATAGTSVYIDRGFSQAQSFSRAQSSG